MKTNLCSICRENPTDTEFQAMCKECNPPPKLKDVRVGVHIVERLPDDGPTEVMGGLMDGSIVITAEDGDEADHSA